jgi:hypothetical protein
MSNSPFLTMIQGPLTNYHLRCMRDVQLHRGNGEGRVVRYMRAVLPFYNLCAIIASITCCLRPRPLAFPSFFFHQSLLFYMLLSLSIAVAFVAAGLVPSAAGNPGTHSHSIPEESPLQPMSTTTWRRNLSRMASMQQGFDGPTRVNRPAENRSDLGRAQRRNMPTSQRPNSRFYVEDLYDERSRADASFSSAASSSSSASHKFNVPSGAGWDGFEQYLAAKNLTPGNNTSSLQSPSSSHEQSYTKKKLKKKADPRVARIKHPKRFARTKPNKAYRTPPLSRLSVEHSTTLDYSPEEDNDESDSLSLDTLRLA